MLDAVNEHCFPALQQLPPEVFKLVLDSVVWAFRHTMRNISELGLSILFKMLQNFNTMGTPTAPAEQREKQQSFFNVHFVALLHHLFSVVTDSAHACSLLPLLPLLFPLCSFPL